MLGTPGSVIFFVLSLFSHFQTSGVSQLMRASRSKPRQSWRLPARHLLSSQLGSLLASLLWPSFLALLTSLCFSKLRWTTLGTHCQVLLVVEGDTWEPFLIMYPGIPRMTLWDLGESQLAPTERCEDTWSCPLLQDNGDTAVCLVSSASE